MSATNTPCSSIAELIARADEALDENDFAQQMRSALRMTEQASDFDDCFVELRNQLHAWWETPPTTVELTAVAEAFIAFVARFTPPHGGCWYPLRDHYRYPEVADWFCQDTAVLHDIDVLLDLPSGQDDSTAHAQSVARAARRLLARLCAHLADGEVLDA